MAWRLQSSIGRKPAFSGPDIVYPGFEPIICEGGAGAINGTWVIETHVGGAAGHAAALAASGGQLGAAIDDSKVPTLVAGMQTYAPGQAFGSNYFENLIYLPLVNRDFHLEQLAKILSATHAAGIETGHYLFPTWSQTDAEDDYIMAAIGQYLDRLDITCYLGSATGPLGVDATRMDESIRKAKRLADGRGIYAWVYTSTVAGGTGNIVSPAKNRLLLDYLATKDIDGIVHWTDLGGIAADQALAEAIVATEFEGGETVPIPFNIFAIQGSGTGKKVVAALHLPPGKVVPTGAVVQGGTITGTHIFGADENVIYFGLEESSPSNYSIDDGTISELPDTDSSPYFVEVREKASGAMNIYSGLESIFEDGDIIAPKQPITLEGVMKNGWLLNGAWSNDLSAVVSGGNRSISFIQRVIK